MKTLENKALMRIYRKDLTVSIDEICSRIVDDAVSTLSVKTAAVLFLDEKGEMLYTKAYKGAWDGDRQFTRDDGVIWKTIGAQKPSTFCRIKETEYCDYIPQLTSLMVCPILGKRKAIGAIVVADKEFGEEFFLSETKLLMAISSQAGLAIENAFLYSELEALLVGAIRCMVKAIEAKSRWTVGYSERVTEYALEIGRFMDIETEMLERLKICSLLHDIGKIAVPAEILNKGTQLTETEWLEIKRHSLVGAEILAEIKQFKDVILGVKYHHEHWDGKGGIFGLRHEEIPLMARILSVADTFDALTSGRPYRPTNSKEDAIKEIVRYSGSQFDPAVVEAFLEWVNA
jgi:HD-GYP domain-containing protein (c-di-GMP phosphodiesterase class II)